MRRSCSPGPRRVRARRDGDLLERFSASSSRGTQEGPIFALSAVAEASPILADDFRDVDDGTGIVHIAPAFGEITSGGGRLRGVPFDATCPHLSTTRSDRQHLRRSRHARDGASFEGRLVKDPTLTGTLIEGSGARPAVEGGGLRHSYPHCWRCGTPLMLLSREDLLVLSSKHSTTSCSQRTETVGFTPPASTQALRGSLFQRRRLTSP